MKALFLSSIMLFLTVGFLSANTDNNEIIDNANLSVELVNKVFEDAYYEIIEVNANENYLLVKDIWKVYVDIDNDKNYITFSLTWSTNEEASLEDKLALVNMISTKVLMVAPYVSTSSGNIVIKYDLWVEGGVSKKNVILSHKAFVKSLHLILELDTELILN
ncbi:MAG: hypothetical protein HKN92_09650 [Chitinophagales bacterium]|nr:hypothetical protein [Chitinophagales bacterium]